MARTVLSPSESYPSPRGKDPDAPVLFQSLAEGPVETTDARKSGCPLEQGWDAQ